MHFGNDSYSHDNTKQASSEAEQPQVRAISVHIKVCCSCSQTISISRGIIVTAPKKELRERADDPQPYHIQLTHIPSPNSTALTNFMSHPTSSTSLSRLARKKSTSSFKGSSQFAALAVSAPC